MKRELKDMIKELKPVKLLTGYYVIEADCLERINDHHFNVVRFENKKRALSFINTLQAIFRDNGGRSIPYNLI